MASLYTTGFALFIRARLQVSAMKRALRKADRAQKNIESAAAKGDLSKLSREFFAKMKALDDAIEHLQNLMHDANLVAFNKIAKDVDMSAVLSKLQQSGLGSKELSPLVAANDRTVARFRQALGTNINEVQRIETAVKKAA